SAATAAATPAPAASAAPAAAAPAAAPISARAPSAASGVVFGSTAGGGDGGVGVVAGGGSGALPGLQLAVAGAAPPAPAPAPAVAPLAFTSASAGDPDAVNPGSDDFWRNADDEQVYSLLSAPTAETPRLVELALLQGTAGQRTAKGLAKYYKKPSSESLKKVVDGKVALIEGGQERALPGGEAEGKFCVSLSKLLHLDEVQCVQVLHAFLRRRNSERPRGSPPASEGLDFSSQFLLFEVR
ncbi:unnamed protein product, partial [Hapterophycus canaliculatus]